jgi:hypothetical protein
MRLFNRLRLWRPRLYRWWAGGKWVLFEGKWYRALTSGPLKDFVDADDGGGFFHYTYHKVERLEDYTK